MIEKWEEIIIIKLIEQDNGKYNETNSVLIEMVILPGKHLWFVRSRHTIKNSVEKAPVDEMDLFQAQLFIAETPFSDGKLNEILQNNDWIQNQHKFECSLKRWVNSQ